MHLTSQSDIYYVLTQVTNISQRNSSEQFGVCWARRLKNGNLSTSENGLYELANTFCNVSPGWQVVAGLHFKNSATNKKLLGKSKQHVSDVKNIIFKKYYSLKLVQ